MDPLKTEPNRVLVVINSCQGSLQYGYSTSIITPPRNTPVLSLPPFLNRQPGTKGRSSSPVDLRIDTCPIGLNQGQVSIPISPCRPAFERFQNLMSYGDQWSLRCFVLV